MTREQRFETTKWEPTTVPQVCSQCRGSFSSIVIMDICPACKKGNEIRTEELKPGEFRFQGQTFTENLGPDD